MPRQIRRLGWKPDLPDHRDLAYSAPLHVMSALPAQVDLRSKCPAVYDQGQLGSCTANGIAGAIEFDLLKQAVPDFVPSRRLFITTSAPLRILSSSTLAPRFATGSNRLQLWACVQSRCGLTAISIRRTMAIHARNARLPRSQLPIATPRRSSTKSSTTVACLGI
jgi:hypothetical protein